MKRFALYTGLFLLVAVPIFILKRKHDRFKTERLKYGSNDAAAEQGL
ncbi:MAG: hypothetical protein V1799_09860 [bacterium]